MAARTPRPPKPKPPKPWRRDGGAYRSEDDRFTIGSGGAGRWFLTDGASLDELGLARTIGPFDTLDDAKAAAAARREHDGEASPLAARLAAAKDRAPAAAGGGTTVSRRTRAGQEPAPGGDDAPGPGPAPEPAPPVRTWLDDLEDADPAAAASARQAIGRLERLGIDDAGALVRRDVLGRQPAIAARLLGRSLAIALGERLDPASLVRDGRAALPAPARALAGVDEAALAAWAAFVAARVLDATLEVVTGTERAEGAGPGLPGWRLVERPAVEGASPRRLIVTRDDVTA